MDASKLALGLSELRQELEEILALVSSDLHDNGAPRNRRLLHSLPTQRDDQPSLSTPTQSTEPHEAKRSRARDDLFDDALVVVTEFGQASPAILQMWLSIDYNRATKILTQFETEGLVSPRGKVRHKAYTLRRSRGMEFRL
jgi:DNA segregation ATPase FtsK/SpoIIIE-like protein